MRTDQELINAFVKAHDENAFVEILSRHSRMVQQVCYRILRDTHEAEDATQAVFIVLMKKAASLRKKSSLGSWLYGVARTVALHALRSRVRISQREKEYTTVQKSMAPDNIQDIDREAVLKLLDCGMASLTERQRQGVVLRYLEGYSEKEAAELAGCSATALSTRANNGILKLRQKLAKHGAVVSMATLFEVLKGEAEAAVLPTLLPSVLAAVKGAATGVAATAVTSNVMALAKGGIKMLFWKKVCTVSCTLGLVGMVGGAGTIVVAQIGEKENGHAKQKFQLEDKVKIEDAILKIMQQQSEIIAYVEVAAIQGPWLIEEGVENWAARCKVLKPVKGGTKKDEIIRFRFTRFIFDGKQEPILVEKGKKYVVFLKGKPGKIRFPSDEKAGDAYRLLDRWVGVSGDNLHLVSRLCGVY